MTKPLITPITQLVAVVPAAGIGKRMKANCPKQYLTIKGKTILEHTVERLLSHQTITQVILSVGENDGYIKDTALFRHPDIQIVTGGKERVDSVLSGLKAIDADAYPWVLVHDAARPCVNHHDLSQLMQSCQEKGYGGILAAPVRDTMKRSDKSLSITKTEERELLWHALTPQMFPTEELIKAITSGIESNKVITDESSAMELANYASHIVEASSENIKITHPDDLALAEFILKKQQTDD